VMDAQATERQILARSGLMRQEREGGALYVPTREAAAAVFRSEGK